MAEKKKSVKGLIGTVVFHLVLLAALYFFGFTTPLPLPAEEGILINFGDNKTGFGASEPAQSKSEPVSRPQPDPQPQNNAAEKEVLSQDFEEAPEIPSGKKEISEEQKKINEEKRRLEIEKIRKQKIEDERIRQEKLEEERKLKEKLEKEKKQAEINNLVISAFSKSRETGKASEGEGNTKGNSNKGNPEGDKSSTEYNGLNTIGGSGIQASLAGRNPLNLPKPSYDYQVEGIVVVEVTVDRNGKVIKAVPGVKGSTTLDQNLLQAAKIAALKAVFDSKINADAYQKGEITYHFKLQ